MADNNNPIKYSDLVSPDDSITKLINQLDQLSDAYMNTLKNIKSEAITVKAALEGVSGATENGRKTIRGGVRRYRQIDTGGKGFGICGKRERKTVGGIEASAKRGERIKQVDNPVEPIRRGFI